MRRLYSQIVKKSTNKQKMLAVLIDPDKITEDKIAQLTNLWQQTAPDFIFVGGSLVNADTETTIKQIKAVSNIPVILFPGNALQLAKNADALLFLSLISGRNAEYLIGQHVVAAGQIKRSGIEVIPTGYILIDGGCTTSVQYISGTSPIPRTKTDIAVATAIAGEMLGLRMLYIEAGSGAKEHVPAEMVKAIRGNVEIPIIVGGGLRDVESINEIYNAGADLVVVGTAIENNPTFLSDIIKNIR